mgnify:CR=1 FL=1
MKPSLLQRLAQAGRAIGGGFGQWQIAIIFALFWGAYLWFSPAVVPDVWAGLLQNGADDPLFPYLAGFSVLAASYFAAWLALGRAENKYLVLTVIFCLALAPRLWVITLGWYQPCYDFLRYFQFGQHFASGDFKWIADQVEQYVLSMPTMGGVAVFFGVLCKVFGTSLFGVQLAGALLSSGICVLIAVLIWNYGQKTATLAALLYAVYPGRIISTAIVTNHHGAVFLFMLALWCCRKYMSAGPFKKRAACAFFCGALLCASNLVHPSVVVVLAAIYLFTVIVVCENGWRERKLFSRANGAIASCFLIAVLTYAVLMPTGVSALKKFGLINTERGTTLLFKFVFGLNQYSKGRYFGPDVKYLRSFSYDEQPKIALDMIKERLEDPEEVRDLLLYKDWHAFFSPDEYFVWFYAWQEEKCIDDAKQGLDDTKDRAEYSYLEDLMTKAGLLDQLWLRIIYLLAVLGALLKPKLHKADLLVALMYISMGWALVIMLTEEQSRYRYPAMPTFFMLAAMGLAGCWKIASAAVGRKVK